MNKIESSQSVDVPKEREKENDMHYEKTKEHDQVETPKETRKKFHGRGFTCDQGWHTKDDFISKPFKPILYFYCHNCHGYGHNVVDCKKPKFDNDNANSRMFRDTNPIGGRRKRSHSNDSGERR